MGTLVTNSQARAACEAEGGTLAIAYGDLARIRVLDFWASFTKWNRKYWIAGTYNVSTNMWHFSDGNLLEDKRILL
jgi:hypothetical protein